MSDPIRQRALREYVELQLQVHDVLMTENHGSAVDDLVKMMEGPWDAMTAEERDLTRLLGSALYRARAGIK